MVYWIVLCLIPEQQFKQRWSKPEGRGHSHDWGSQIKDTPGKSSEILKCASVSMLLTVIDCCLLQYKVRAFIQMKSSKACKREIKSVMNTAGNVSLCLCWCFFITLFKPWGGGYRVCMWCHSVWKSSWSLPFEWQITYKHSYSLPPCIHIEQTFKRLLECLGAPALETSALLNSLRMRRYFYCYSALWTTLRP